MTPVQRQELAGVLLTVGWSSDGSSLSPSVALAAKFAGYISDVCANNPSRSVSSVALALYDGSTDLRPGN
jgi:hypothetical protein